MSNGYILQGAGNMPPVVPLQFTTDAGIAVPAANNLNVLGGSGASTSGAGSTVTINVINDGFPWSDQGVNFAASPQNGYFCTGALTVTLPTVGIVSGSTVIIYVDTSDPVIIQAGGAQQIEISQTSTIPGGTATSTLQGNIVQLTYRLSDDTWHAISSMGTWGIA